MELNKILIGNRIKQERLTAGLTQEELAQKLGLNNKSSISQYEKGDAIPSDDIKLQMCNIFNCSLDYLIGKSDVKNTIQNDSAEIRAIARNITKLSPEKKELFKNLLAEMSKAAEEANKE